MNDDIRVRVIKYLLEAIDTEIAIENVHPEMSLREDLDFDSLASVELVLNLEDEFNMSLTDSEVANIKTVGDIYELINLKTQQKEEVSP